MSGRGWVDVYLPDVEYSQPYEEGPSLPIEGWLHTLVAPESTTTTKNRVDNNHTVATQQPEHEGMLIEREGVLDCPKL